LSSSIEATPTVRAPRLKASNDAYKTRDLEAWSKRSSPVTATKAREEMKGGTAGLGPEHKGKVAGRCMDPDREPSWDGEGSYHCSTVPSWLPRPRQEKEDGAIDQWPDPDQPSPLQ
jgi:hypothetical protein